MSCRDGKVLLVLVGTGTNARGDTASGIGMGTGTDGASVRSKFLSWVKCC